MTRRIRSTSIVLIQILCLSLILMAGETKGQLSATADPASKMSLALRWRVVDNGILKPPCCRSELVLSNRGKCALPISGWALYFDFFQEIDSLPQGAPLTLQHLNGDFYRLEPSSTFPSMQPGASIVIPLVFPSPIIDKSLAPSGFYVVTMNPDGTMAKPQPITDVSVGSFSDPAQNSRGSSDHLSTSSPELRFRENQSLTLLPPGQVGEVLPTPVSMQHLAGEARITPQTIIICSPQFENEAGYLADALQPLLGVRLRIDSTATAEASENRITLGAPTDEDSSRPGSDESYTLKVTAPGSIAITGNTAAGVFYGIQTLRALIPVRYYRQTHPAVSLRAALVSDAPRFPYRGLTLDVARHFQSKETVFKLLDAMAFYKLNKLQLHLTDDEGWRLEIAGLPELTGVGGRRGHTINETDHLVPSFGSGPDADSLESHGSGFYTRADFIAILRYAQLRHIEVIPEIESPGHARAAIKSMQARYHHLVDRGMTDHAQADLLSDPEDKSSYRSVQGWTDNVIDVCLPSSLHFMEKVFGEVGAIYTQAGVQLKTIHVGGDEVPNGAWLHSPACQLVSKNGLDSGAAARLRNNFLRQIDASLHRMGVTTAVWEEALVKSNSNGEMVADGQLLDHHMVAYAWNNVWGEEDSGAAYIMANAGYDVVMAQASNLYFDMPYSKDPDEPGNPWAGYVDTRQVYEFTPMNFYAAARIDTMGNPIHPCSAFKDRVQLSENGKRHILGLQGSQWSEHGSDQSATEYFIFPKLLALAERAWARQPEWESDCDGLNSVAFARDWNEFSNQLSQRELPRLSYLNGGYMYRIPPPGAVAKQGTITANTALPGFSIRYTINGDQPDARSAQYTHPFAARGRVQLRSFNPKGRGSRTSLIGADSKPVAR